MALSSVSSHRLAADVGGTKTTLALYRAGGRVRAPAHSATLPSADFESLEKLIRSFLGGVGDPPVGRVAIGVAGPVIGGRARVTNLPWLVDGDELRKSLDAESVTLLNDLAAMAHALPTLEADQLAMIQEGDPEPDGAHAVVAPGTGLGMASIVRSRSEPVVVPSEAGHCSFSPIDDRQSELLAYLRERHDHVSFEQVCSGGLGVPNLYRFLRDSGRCAEPRWLAEALERADDPTAAIFEAAAEGGCEICAETVALFLEILGVASANLVLTVLATGGLFLGGGMLPRIIDTIRASGFLRAFTSKGRFSDLLGRVPVHVITDPRASLWGAACHVLGA